MSIFSAFSPLNGGDASHYYNDRAYPMDLNGSQDYGRPKTGVDFFPYPYLIGYVKGLLPVFDGTELSVLFGPKPGGMPVNALASPEVANALFPTVFGDMQKVRG